MGVILGKIHSLGALWEGRKSTNLGVLRVKIPVLGVKTGILTILALFPGGPSGFGLFWVFSLETAGQKIDFLALAISARSGGGGAGFRGVENRLPGSLSETSEAQNRVDFEGPNSDILGVQNTVFRGRKTVFWGFRRVRGALLGVLDVLSRSGGQKSGHFLGVKFGSLFGV